MVKKKIAKSTEEFDRRFDDGEDIHDLIDISSFLNVPATTIALRLEKRRAYFSYL